MTDCLYIVRVVSCHTPGCPSHILSNNLSLSLDDHFIGLLGGGLPQQSQL